MMEKWEAEWETGERRAERKRRWSWKEDDIARKMGKVEGKGWGKEEGGVDSRMRGKRRRRWLKRKCEMESEVKA